jgi:hypothetical protein
VREVARVPHRDHRIIEQREISFAANDEAGAVDEQPGVDEKRREQYPENTACAPKTA